MRIALLADDGSNGSQVEARLFDALTSRGHVVESVRVPPLGTGLANDLAAYLHCSRLDLSDHDVVLATSVPGWLVRADQLVVYEAGSSISTDAPSALDDLQAIEVPHALIEAVQDRANVIGDVDQRAEAEWLRQRLAELALRNARLLAAASEFSARSLDALAGDRPVLVAPLGPTSTSTRHRVPPRTIGYTESRFDGSDRVETIIAGFSACEDKHAELRIEGDGPRRRHLEEASEDHRVRFIGDLRTDERQNELAGASSVLVAEFDLGWSALAVDAMAAGTPIIVSDDAGGPTELVEHGVNGLVVDGSAERFGWGIRHVASNPRLRWQFGLQARRRAAAIDLAPFLDALDELDAPPRPSVLTLSTYPIEPMIGGGQRRARFLHRSMSEVCDVTVLVNSSPLDRVRRRLIEPGLVQVEIPKSDAQREAELDIFHAMDGLPVDDITASILSLATPEFGREIEKQLATSDVVIATQPFLLPCIPSTTTPIVHDSQNVEANLKAALLPDSEGGRWLLDRASEAEAEAAVRAAVVTACTEADLEALVPKGGIEVAGLVVGNGVDAAALPRKTAHQYRATRAELLAVAGRSTDDERPIALFIGSWHPPNVEAARVVIDLASLRPEWLFILAGSHTSEFAGEDLPPNVHTIAVFAESMLWPLLAGADVALNPMSSGGGTNLKLFDYLAVGTTVVTTATGARGLEHPDAVAIIADATAAAFAEAIDRAEREQCTHEAQIRTDAGRALVERSFDWPVLGEQWSRGILGALGIAPGPTRRRSRSRTPVITSLIEPPSTDPVLATIQLLGLQARSIEPTAQGASMDPTLRERIKRANDHRNIGRELPPGARFAGPKRALIRVGHALTNEQVIYNEAVIDAIEQLAVTIQRLELQQRQLERRLDTAMAEDDRLGRPSGGDE
jgi:glycosyltransferase involved in cell wall biosynthesis